MSVLIHIVYCANGQNAPHKLLEKLNRSTYITRPTDPCTAARDASPHIHNLFLPYNSVFLSAYVYITQAVFCLHDFDRNTFIEFHYSLPTHAQLIKTLHISHLKFYTLKCPCCVLNHLIKTLHVSVSTLTIISG